MSKIRISPDLALPIDVVTSTLVVYGGKGMGKTNLASVLIEELTKAGLRWCLLDPMGVSWGLRHSADGKGPGVECVILGGAHGDIPIEPTGGAIVADLVVDENANVIIDFSRKANGQMWTLGEKVRFVTEYTLRLFQRQGELVNGHRREPLMQLLDEAARYIPQVIPSGAIELAKCVGAWEQVCEEGRNIGLGVGFITQRSARMNKSVSELADVMFAFRTVGPNSLAAIMDWLGEHVEKAKVKTLAEQVRSLNVGQALVVSPGWLKVEQVVQIRARETFDSSATPKPGQSAKKVTGIAAKPDLGKYNDRMAATIERVKADDPKALRMQLAERDRAVRELERQVSAAMTQPAVKQLLKEEYERGKGDAETESTKRVAAFLADAELTVAHLREEVASFAAKLTVEAKSIDGLRGYIELPLGLPSVPYRHVPPRLDYVSASAVEKIRLHDVPAPKAERTKPFNYAGVDGAFEVSASEQKVLDAIAFMKRIGSPLKKQSVAFFSGYAIAGRFNNLVGSLRSKALIDYPQPNMLELTTRGARVANADAADVRTLDDLHRLWVSKLDASQSKVLRAVLATSGGSITKADLAAETGYEIAGRFNNLLGSLRSLGAIDYPQPGYVAAGEALYPEGLR